MHAKKPIWSLILIGLLSFMTANAAGATHFYLVRVTTGAGQTKENPYPYANQLSSDPDGYIVARSDLAQYIHIPVRLPDGATIDYLNAYGEDTSYRNITISLKRANWSSQSSQQLAAITSNNNGTWWGSAAINHYVNNDNSVYWIDIYIPKHELQEGAHLYTWNVEIQYTTP